MPQVQGELLKEFTEFTEELGTMSVQTQVEMIHGKMSLMRKNAIEHSKAGTETEALFAVEQTHRFKLLNNLMAGVNDLSFKIHAAMKEHGLDKTYMIVTALPMPTVVDMVYVRVVATTDHGSVTFDLQDLDSFPSQELIASLVLIAGPRRIP